MEPMITLTSEVTKGLLPKYYMMNPRREDMIPTGRFLQEGMKVTYAASDRRVNTSVIQLTEWQYHRALQTNRWFTVTDLSLINGVARFVGVFEDETKLMISEPETVSWLVKKDTIPDPAKIKVQNSQRYTLVYAEVRMALEEQSRSKVTGVDADLIERTTTRILGQL